jgi:hypothetical protein
MDDTVEAEKHRCIVPRGDVRAAEVRSVPVPYGRGKKEERRASAEERGREGCEVRPRPDHLSCWVAQEAWVIA